MLLSSSVLELAIGLIFVFFVMSIISSALTEVISAALGLRANNLEAGIKNILGDPKARGLARQFFDHPLIKGLTKDGKRWFWRGPNRPSYIPAATFTRTLLDLVPAAGATPDAPPPVPEGVSETDLAHQVANINAALATLGARDDLETLRREVGSWFDQAMERVSGWYKRRAQAIILVVGGAVIVFTNADTVTIANTLWQDPTVREQAVALAQRAVDQPRTSTSQRDEASKLGNDLGNLNLLGWRGSSEDYIDPREVPTEAGAWAAKVVGFLITLGAVSLGANFWFDLLKRFINPRSAGAETAKTPESPPDRSAAREPG